MPILLSGPLCAKRLCAKVDVQSEARTLQLNPVSIHADPLPDIGKAVAIVAAVESFLAKRVSIRVAAAYEYPMDALRFAYGSGS